MRDNNLEEVADFPARVRLLSPSRPGQGASARATMLYLKSACTLGLERATR